MRGHPEQIDEALVTLSSRIAEQLSAEGWSRRLLDERTIATLTRSTQNGVTAVIEVDRTSSQWPDDWPVEVETSLGVGYEPALNLMPLLTLRPRATLIDDPEHGRANSFIVKLTGPDTVTHAAQQIVQFVNKHASATAENFPDAAAIDAQLQREIDAAQTRCDLENEDEENDPGASDFDTQLRLVVLAATGRHEDARALLATYPAERTDEAIDREDRRFIRQLTRWLEAGGPVAPPVEDTLAQLPQRARPPRPSWSDARAKSKAKKEALDAARARSKGKNRDQLEELIAAEYSARGIGIAPSVVDINADMLQSEQQPFGRARTAIKAIWMLKSGGGDMIRLIKHADDHDPEWLRPPDRASYPIIAGRGRYVAVEMHAVAHDWLERVRAEAPRRVGPWVLIDVWLSREEPAGPLTAHIGERLVGTVPHRDSGEFNDVMRTAVLSDEDPFVRGRLTSANGAGTAVLEIPLPQHPNRRAAAT